MLPTPRNNPTVAKKQRRNQKPRSHLQSEHGKRKLGTVDAGQALPPLSDNLIHHNFKKAAQYTRNVFRCLQAHISLTKIHVLHTTNLEAKRDVHPSQRMDRMVPANRSGASVRPENRGPRLDMLVSQGTAPKPNAGPLRVLTCSSCQRSGNAGFTAHNTGKWPAQTLQLDEKTNLCSREEPTLLAMASL